MTLPEGGGVWDSMVRERDGRPLPGGKSSQQQESDSQNDGMGKASDSGWLREQRAFSLSQLPLFQFKETKRKLKRQQERLGPGTYNIRDFLQETRPCSLRGICDTREPRFRDGRRDCFPGPGTYGPQGNPYASLEERDKRPTGTRGLMDSRTPKCALPAATGSGLGPGTYDLRGSIEEGLRRACSFGLRKVSSRDRSKPASGGRQALEQKRDTELDTVPVKGFVDKLMSNENKKKGCFSTLLRSTGCLTEGICRAMCSRFPSVQYAVGPGSYNPKPIGSSEYSNQPPFWSSAKRFDSKSRLLFTGNQQHQQHIAEPVQNPVGVGRYDITRHEKALQKMRHQALYPHDAQRYLSNLKQDAYLHERLKPAARSSWRDMVSARCCPDTSDTADFQT
ncbi:ciliary microtubule-associated protein 2 [Melanerpes formicivorus]|uniref:ciliary microtubule-associated protein 2 n=1 Tax=Melanerpes formicivorus TaxID=211600 RepID=UPI00358E2276